MSTESPAKGEGLEFLHILAMTLGSSKNCIAQVNWSKLGRCWDFFLVSTISKSTNGEPVESDRHVIMYHWFKSQFLSRWDMRGNFEEIKAPKIFQIHMYCNCIYTYIFTYMHTIIYCCTYVCIYIYMCIWTIEYRLNSLNPGFIRVAKIGNIFSNSKAIDIIRKTIHLYRDGKKLASRRWWLNVNPETTLQRLIFQWAINLAWKNHIIKFKQKKCSSHACLTSK